MRVVMRRRKSKLARRAVRNSSKILTMMTRKKRRNRALPIIRITTTKMTGTRTVLTRSWSVFMARSTTESNRRI
jgi:hypothetical protein